MLLGFQTNIFFDIFSYIILAAKTKFKEINFVLSKYMESWQKRIFSLLSTAIRDLDGYEWMGSDPNVRPSWTP